MRNPFKQEDNSGKWIIALFIGAVAAGVVSYLYFKDADLDWDERSQEEHDHATDYLKTPKKRKKTTDVHDLENLVHH